MGEGGSRCSAHNYTVGKALVSIERKIIIKENGRDLHRSSEKGDVVRVYLKKAELGGATKKKDWSRPTWGKRVSSKQKKGSNLKLTSMSRKSEKKNKK